MRIPTKAWLLAGASALAMGASGAQAQSLVEFGSGTITAPNATTGASIGLLANQINDALTGSALVSGGAGATLTPGSSSAADATTTVNANTISATIAGNLAAPATGQLYTVNLAGMDGAGGGYAASTIFQLNNAPNVLAGVGVDATGTPVAGTQAIGSAFATTLTSTAAVTGNVIGSTAVGNQTSNVVGGVTPGAGVAGGSASVNVIGAEQLRTNTATFTAPLTTLANTDPLIPADVVTASAGDIVITADGATAFYVISEDPAAPGGATTTYLRDASSPSTGVPIVDGTYSAVADPGGSVNGVIAATTLQRNTGLDSGTQIRAITDSARVAALLGAGATGATLDNSVNAVTASATGNQATTGIAVTGGAPSINGGLAVLNEQVNATSGATGAGAGISALNNAGSVVTQLGDSVASSTVLMEGNQLSASATGSAATNTLSADMLVRLNAAATPATGSGTGSISTGALLSRERVEAFDARLGTPGTSLGESAYVIDAENSSGVGGYVAAGATADYLVANIQRNSGTGTTPLAITADTTGGEISLRTTVTGGTTGVTASGSTIGLTENTISAAATGARATTQIGNGTATMLGDGASLAALSLQEATSTSTRATVSGSSVVVGLEADGVAVATGGSIAMASNAITASALTNVGTTTLSNIAASGGTLANGSFTSGLRNDVTGDNLDAQYAAPLAAISAQRVTTVDDGTGALATGGASIASATVSGSDVLLELAGSGGTAATGSTLSLTGNRTTATAGANQANVGVSFAEGMGSVIPGGAVAASSQLLAPGVDGTSVTASISGSEMQVIAASTGTADSLSGGSVTASANRIAAQAVGNQGTASMTGSSMLIAGGPGGTGASATLDSGVAPSPTAPATSASADILDAQGSYLVANTQRVAPTAGNTMGISSSVTDGSISVVAGGSATTVAVANNVVTAIGAANVFDGRMTSLSSSGGASVLAVSQQDAMGTAVSASLAGGGAVASTGNSGLSLDGTTASAALSGGSLSVASNTFRALAVVNEGTLVVADAGVQDLGTTGGGRIATVSANGGATSQLSLSGVEVGAASQQSIALDSGTATAPAVAAVATSTVSGVRVGLNGDGAITTTSLGVTGNTVDARTMGNTATVAASGDVFAGGVAVANSQNVTQSGTAAGLSATNTGSQVGVDVATAPPIGTASMEVANNTVSSMAVANEAQLQLAALVPGSLGNGNLGTRGNVGLSTGTGTSSFVSGVDADYLAASVQTTSGLVANATTGSTAAGTTIRAVASVTGGTVALNGNRVTAETVANRASASTALPALNAGYVQTASFQANTGGNLASNIVNARVAFDASSPSTTVGSSVGLNNNAILASTMGNVFNGTQSMAAGGTNYAQTASRQINSGTSIAASVTDVAVVVAGNGGLSTTSMGGNTIGASAMGNVLRATVGAR